MPGSCDPIYKERRKKKSVEDEAGDHRKAQKNPIAPLELFKLALIDPMGGVVLEASLTLLLIDVPSSVEKHFIPLLEVTTAS